MELRLLLTSRLSKATHVVWLGPDMALFASPDSLSWCNLDTGELKLLQTCPHGARSMSLFPICNHEKVVVHMESSTWTYSLRIVDKQRLMEHSWAIPFVWVRQMSSDPTAGTLALFGDVAVPNRAG